MNNYVFEGRVIKLNAKDYDRFWRNYVPWMKEEQYLWELTNIDDWLESNGSQSNWFWQLGGALKKKKPN